MIIIGETSFAPLLAYTQGLGGLAVHWERMLREPSCKGPKAYTSITAIVCWIIQRAGLTFKVH